MKILDTVSCIKCFYDEDKLLAMRLKKGTQKY